MPRNRDLSAPRKPVEIRFPTGLPVSFLCGRPQNAEAPSPHVVSVNPTAKRPWNADSDASLLAAAPRMPSLRPSSSELNRKISRLRDPPSSQTPVLTPYGMEGLVENTSNILTVKEVADVLRCSKTHALNVIEGKVRGLPKLTHLRLGRRKVVRKDWLDQWMEANKTR